MTQRFTEDELIEKLFAPLAGPAGLGLMDDAALLPAGEESVATVDALVAGVHFFADDPPGAIAKKALRVNLSDLAAKGAEPLGFLLALALPEDWTNDWLAAFAQGLGEDASRFSCPLLGGDTVKTPGPLTLSITALGRVRERFIARAGAKVGDGVFVSGTIGDAALGLRLRKDPAFATRLSASSREFLLDRYLLPRPRLDLAPLLRENASAAMDISDGLLGDLAKLARASKVSARVALADIPFSDAAREALALAPELLETLLSGGDDYELLACGDAARLAGDPGVEGGFSRIGEVVAGLEPPRFLDERGKALEFKTLSFSHF